MWTPGVQDYLPLTPNSRTFSNWIFFIFLQHLQNICLLSCSSTNNKWDQKLCYKTWMAFYMKETGFISLQLHEYVHWQYIDACSLSVINPWLCIYISFYKVGSKTSLLTDDLKYLPLLEAGDYHPDKDFTCSELIREQYLSFLAMRVLLFKPEWATWSSFFANASASSSERWLMFSAWSSRGDPTMVDGTPNHTVISQH